MRAFLKSLVDKVCDVVDLRDVFVFGGLLLASAGLWQIYPPLALVASGVALFWLGVRK